MANGNSTVCRTGSTGSSRGPFSVGGRRLGRGGLSATTGTFFARPAMGVFSIGRRPQRASGSSISISLRSGSGARLSRTSSMPSR